MTCYLTYLGVTELRYFLMTFFNYKLIYKKYFLKHFTKKKKTFKVLLKFQQSFVEGAQKVIFKEKCQNFNS